MIKLVIFDRDGVINELIRDCGSSRSPRRVSEVVIDWNIKSLMQKLHSAGIKMAIATNQPEISRGMITRETLLSINQELLRKLSLNLEFFICYHDTSDECFCRKPKPGLLLQIAERFGFAIREIIFIGDRIIDKQAATQIDMQFLLYRGRRGKRFFELTAEDGKTFKLQTKDVLNWIVNQ